MKYLSTVLIVAFFSKLSSVNGQTAIWTKADSLLFYSDAMLTCTVPKFREAAAEKFKPLLLEYLNAVKPSDDNLNFENRIAVIQPSNQDFTLYSWQYQSQENEWKYEAVIRWSSGRINELTREIRDYNRIRMEVFGESNWYGAMYYFILPILENTKNEYTLFGFAQDQQDYKYKIIETITVEDEKLTFGKPIYRISDDQGGTDKFFRQVIPYSKESNCVVEFNEAENEIQYDHIATITDNFTPANKILKIPDGSYESLSWTGTYWKHDPHLKIEPLNQAPRTKPVLGNDNKDILGRDLKKK